MFLADTQQGVHFSHLAEEMHRQDHPGFSRHGGFHPVGVDIEGRWIDVDQHRSGAQADGSGHGSHKSIWGGDHFVALIEAQRHQRHQQGVRS